MTPLFNIKYLEYANSWSKKVEQRLLVAGGGANGELFHEYRASVWDDEKILKVVVMVTYHCEYAY